MKEQLRNLVNQLGPDNMANRLGVTQYSLRYAVQAECFPSSWYVVVREMCAAKGIDCPEKLFNFKAPSKNTDEAVDKPAQGDAA